MPAVKTKHYVVAIGIAQSVQNFAPQTPGRVQLTIQNTGVAQALFRLELEVQDDGGDIVLNPGDRLQWTHPDTTPREALSAYSEMGTTLAVIEGVV